MLNSVKTRLRISHNKLDDDIKDTIDAAKAELNRLGISKEYTDEENDPLILQAIKTYCLSVLAPTQKDRDGYENAFKYMLDCLSKTKKYRRDEGV